MTARPKITGAIITFNEEKRIERCVRSLDWLDEVVIIDAFSSDRTAEICGRLGARVFPYAWPHDFAVQRSRAHLHAANDWMLFLDADEVVTRGLRDEIIALFEAGPRSDAYGIPRREFFGGKWINAGGWYPQYKTILYRRSRGAWVNPVHEKFVPEGGVAYLGHPILHDGYGDFSTFMDKYNGYSSVEADRTFREGKRRTFSLFKAIVKPIERFLGRYIRHRGYRDGMHGFYMAAVISFNYFLHEFKFYERLYASRSQESWDAVYRSEAVGAEKMTDDGR